MSGAERSWDALLRDPRAPKEIADISWTIGGALDAMEAGGGPAALDLRGLDPAGVSLHHLVAILRTCFRPRAEVLGWDEALLVAIDACALHGVDARSVLRGLL